MKTKYTLMLNRKIIKEDLVNLHGIGSAKSLSLEFPNVPNCYLSHFMRGYFDGDGCIYKDKFFVNIVSGSHKWIIILC